MSTTISATRQLHFRDRRAPHKVQFAVERERMTLLTPSLEDARLTFRADGKSNGVPYRVLLRLEAALFLTNCYLLQFEAAEKICPRNTPADGENISTAGWTCGRAISPANPRPSPAKAPPIAP